MSDSMVAVAAAVEDAAAAEEVVTGWDVVLVRALWISS